MEGKAVLVTGDGIGRGDHHLGQVILADILMSVGQRQEKPAAIILLNGGVKLACSGAEAFEAQEHLRELVGQGVKVLACRTCLEHFARVERVVVGEIGGMPGFVELMAEHQVPLSWPLKSSSHTPQRLPTWAHQVSPVPDQLLAHRAYLAEVTIG